MTTRFMPHQLNRRKLVTILLAFMVIFLVAPNALANGLVATGRCDNPPVLDGTLDDACWHNAIEISPFMLARTRTMASEQTSAWILHDEHNIYVAFKCAASVLDPVENRLHEFLDAVTANDDAKIYKDDHVMVILAPSPSVCYEFTINANSAVLDARCTGPNYWAGRDLSWNSNAKAKARRYNGFWVVEMAIPIKSLGVLTREWKFVTGRNNRAAGEISAFGHVPDGLHDEVAQGRLIFMLRTPSLTIANMPAFAPGRNVLSLTTSRGIVVEQVLKAQDGKVLKESAMGGPPKIQSDMSFPEGMHRYSFTVSDASTNARVFELPEYTVTIGGSSLVANIDSPGVYEYTLNGLPGATDLSRGSNTLVIKASKGTAGSFTVGEEVFEIDSSWLFSDGSGEWSPAPIEGGVLQRDGVLKKVILFEESLFWPNWAIKGWSICRGSVGQLLLSPHTQNELGKVDDYALNIELPDGIEPVGASTHYQRSKVAVDRLGPVSRAGRQYTKYQVSVSPPSRYDPKVTSHWQHIGIVLRATKSAPDSADMYYYAQAKGGNIQEVPQRLGINVLDELVSKRPRRSIIQLWVGYARVLDDENLRRTLNDQFMSAGFNQIMDMRFGPIDGATRFRTFHLRSDEMHTPEFLAENPDMAMVGENGKEVKGRICPGVLLEEEKARSALTKKIRKWYEPTCAENVVWDYEFGPFTPYIACYCPRCLKEFGHGDIAAATIKKKYPTEWQEFMTTRMANLAGMLREVFRSLNPHVTFSVYSGYQSDRTKSLYGVDWAKLNGKIDIASMGYGRKIERLLASYEALGDTTMVLGEIVYPHRITDRSSPRQPTPAILMRRLLDSRGGGFMVWNFSSTDGELFQAVNKVARVLADYEDVFLRNDRRDDAVRALVPTRERCVVLDHPSHRLVILLNDTGRNVEYMVDLKTRYPTIDYYKNKPIDPRHVQTGDLEAGEIKVFVIDKSSTKAGQ